METCDLVHISAVSIPGRFPPPAPCRPDIETTGSRISALKYRSNKDHLDPTLIHDGIELVTPGRPTVLYRWDARPKDFRPVTSAPTPGAVKAKP